MGCPFVWNAALSAKLARRGSRRRSGGRAEGLPWDGETSKGGGPVRASWTSCGGRTRRGVPSTSTSAASRPRVGGTFPRVGWLAPFPAFAAGWPLRRRAVGTSWSSSGCTSGMPHASVIANAAWSGHLEAIKWLRSVRRSGAPRRSRGFRDARSDRGPWWMVQNGCPWDENARLEAVPQRPLLDRGLPGYRRGAKLTHTTTPMPYQ